MLSRRWAFAGCMIVAMMVLVAGCSLDSGNPLISTDDGSEGLVAPDRVADHSQFVTYRQAPERALAKRGGKQDRDDDEDEDRYTQKKIKKSKGGKLELGDEEEIKVTLKIKRKSIPKDETISMALPAGEVLIVGIGGEDGIIFGPSGLVFDPWAELTIKSENIVLPEGDVYLCYWDADAKDWLEWADAEVTVKVKGDLVTIKAKVPHFSRYAFRTW